MARQLTDAQRLAWLRLVRTPKVGPQTFRLLVNRYGGAEAALDALPALSRRSAGRTVTIPTQAEAEAEIAAGQALGARLVAHGEPGYPDLLGHIHGAPPLLWVRGNIAALDRPAIAIVGARNASGLGRKFARFLAAELAEAGYLIVSGLARGIDTAAHEGSLAGGTVAVFAGGLGHVYPEENAGLAGEITGNGLVMSERAPDWAPRGRDFPARNRIISGTALGVVVVEAARRSGSLITARMAADQNREVMAVPGSPLDPRAEGTNRLIQEGAAMILSSTDVVEALGSAASRPESLPGLPIAFDEDTQDSAIADVAPDTVKQAVLSCLGAASLDLDTLVRETGYGSGMVIGAVIELELAGAIRWAGPLLLERGETGASLEAG